MNKLFVMDHPLIQHKVALMRRKDTGTKEFRELLEEVAMLMAYEVTRDLPLRDIEVETPICTCTAKEIAGKKLAIVPILRAGLGMVDGITKRVPSARVGHIGLYRDPQSLEPVEYYCKLPQDVDERICLLVDPMLATGGSATAALEYLRKQGVSDIRLLCIVAAPEGIKAVQDADPNVKIFACAVDEGLNENAYIVPGLGDAGDRIFGTL